MRQKLTVASLSGLMLLSLLSFVSPVLGATPDHLYGCTSNNGSNSSLYGISTVNGAGTLIGAMGMFGCSGLAFNSAGTLFAVGQTSFNGPEELFTVNIATGAASRVGQINATSTEIMADISVQPSTGVLFGSSTSISSSPPSNLWRISTSTGAASFVGEINGTETENDGALAFNQAGTLYWSGVNSADPFIPVFTLNSASAAPTFQFRTSNNMTTFCSSDSNPDHGLFNAFDFNSTGTLYASVDCTNGGGIGSVLATVNLSTHAVTNIGITVNTLDGIAFLPSSIPPPPPTTIVIGWNAPSASTLSHGIFAFILVLLGVVFFGLLSLLFNYKGDFTVTLMLIGAVGGLTFATLPSNGTNSFVVPFGSIVLGGFLLVVWLWKGGRGGMPNE